MQLKTSQLVKTADLTHRCWLLHRAVRRCRWMRSNRHGAGWRGWRRVGAEADLEHERAPRRRRVQHDGQRAFVIEQRRLLSLIHAGAALTTRRHHGLDEAVLPGNRRLH